MFPRLSRVMSAVALLALALGPLSTAPAFAQSIQVSPSVQISTAAISGTVTDSQGSPVQGATVTLRGPLTYTATSDALGHYTVNVRSGVYTAVAQKSGYLVATENDVAVLDTAVTLNVQLASATFSSLQTIGRTASRRGTSARSTFNATPAAQQILGQQVFRDQGDLQVRNELNQTPGIISGLPPSVNPASPGAITFPNIRGALAFETTALVDGHPLSVGKYGDYVTSFINPYALQSVELIKGPGAAAPEISRAIGGTVNFRTLDPTVRPSGNLTFGVDSFGGTFSNIGYSQTLLNGKLGFVVDYSVNGTPGPAGTGYLGNFLPQNSSSWTYTDSRGNVVKLPTSPFKASSVPGQNNQNPYASTTVLGHGALTPTTFTDKTELAKVRYNVSPVTSVTASVLASQTWSDQNGNNGNLIPTNFTPGAGYAGAIAAGANQAFHPFWYGDEWEINNEPIFQGEFRTAFHDDNILARYYHASISRLQYNGATSPTQASPLVPVQLYGTDANGNPLNGNDPYGKPYLAQQTSGYYFSSAEEDKLYGFSFEYDHSLGKSGDLITFAADQNYSATHAYNQFQPETNASVPAGSTQDTGTYLLRGQFELGPKLNATGAYYLTRFASHFGSAVYNGTTSAATPTLKFFDQTLWHNDARLGLAYRLDRDTSLRFAAGSAVAPPYLAVLATATRPAALCTQQSPTACPPGITGVAVNSLSGQNVKSETSFGYNLGFDYRFPSDPLTIVSADVYSTNLYNQFVSTQYANGTVTLPGVGNVPLYTSSYGNLSASRYQGVELAVSRSPQVGFGYVAQGALIRGYALNVPPGGYPGQPGIVNNINFGDHSISNQAIPYAQGYFEANYHTLGGGYLALGGTYYGANNGFDIPATVFFNATMRLPVHDRQTHLQISADNLFNQYPGLFPTLYTGVGVPYSNGQFYATATKYYGPRNVRISVSHDFGH